MPKAKNTLQVSFESAIEKIRGHRRAEIVVRFCYQNDANEKIAVKSIRASSLLKDWYDECNLCPANDAVINRLHILLNSSCTALDVTEEVLFGQLMDTIEAVTAGHNAR